MRKKSNRNPQSQNPLLKGLNPAQMETVLSGEGPILVAAGAGSGKTKIIAHRIGHLISQGGEPDKILAITFTNKACQEMRERIKSLLKELGVRSDAKKPFVLTFHSLGAHILRRAAGKTGLNSNFSILDEDDSLSLVKEAEKTLGLDPKQFPPNRIKNIISREKGKLVSAEEYQKSAEGEFFPETLSKIWVQYEELLSKHNAVDYDDLLLKPAKMFEKRPEVRAEYQNKWHHLLIDEYQDTNHSQYVLSRILAEKHRNIFAVGDIDQAIYGWRGADFRNILAFQNDWPEAKIFTLEENYRSTPIILEAANFLIGQNKERLPKNLFTKKTEGELIEFFNAGSEEEEAMYVRTKILQLLEEGNEPSEIGVLFRVNFQSRILEEKFLASDIPHQVVGLRFYERKEIKDVLAYLRAALNPSDKLSRSRIINVPTRGIGKVLQLKYFAKDKNLSPDEKEKIGNFEKLIFEIKRECESKSASQAIDFIVKKTGYLSLFGASQEEDLRKIANIKELAVIAEEFDKYEPAEGVLKLLEQAALINDQDAIKEDGGVKLMTVHSAKGLEFDYVFVCGLEEGLFPHALSQIGKNGELEEERRLFYVALTRARKKIFLSFSNFRRIMGEKQINLPSRFLSEIPPHLINPF